jgi:hypothetical protein
MKMTKYFRVTALVLAASFLAYAFWIDGQRLAAVITLSWCLLWGFSLKTEQDSIPSIFFVVYSAACLVGTYMGFRIIFLLVGFIAAMSAWDIDRFLLRWKVVEAELAIEKRHLIRLLAVDSVGFLLAVVGFSYKIRLGFTVMLLVGAFTIIGLIWIINLLRSAGSR